MAQDIYQELFELLFQFQLRSRSFTASESPPLSLSEGNIILELLVDEAKNINEIAEAINLERSTVSRTIGSLERRGLLRRRKSQTDKRARVIAVTKKGHEHYARWEHMLSDLTRRQTYHLSTREESDFCHALTVLADGYHAAAISRASLNPVRAQTLRVNRFSGVLGKRFLGRELSLLQVQALYVLEQIGKPLSASELAEQLPFDTSTVSRGTSDLEERGLIRKVASKNDRRKQMIALTPRGKREHSAILSDGTESLRAALADSSKQFVRDFIRLTRKALSPIPDDALEVEDFEVRRLDRESEQAEARGFFVEATVYARSHFELTAELFLPSSHCYGLFLVDSLVGVAELQQQDKRWVLENYYLRSDLDTAEFNKAFLRGIFEDGFSSTTTKNIFVPRSSSASPRLRRINSATRNKNGVTLAKRAVGEL